VESAAAGTGRSGQASAPRAPASLSSNVRLLEAAIDDGARAAGVAAHDKSREQIT
jgi:hypothetical protein